MITLQLRHKTFFKYVVRGGGLEPPHHCWRQDLNLVRLPISPPAQKTEMGSHSYFGIKAKHCDHSLKIDKPASLT